MIPISDSFIAFLSAVGVLNSLFLSFYFFFLRKGNVAANKTMSLLLMAFSLMIGKSLLLFLFDDLNIIIKKIGLTGYVSIGAALYLYIQAYTKHNISFKLVKLLHFLPAFLLFFSIPIPKTEIVFQYRIFYLTILTINLFYLLHVIYYYLKNKSLFDQKDIFIQGIDKLWIRNLIIGVSLVWLAYFLFVCFGILYMTGAIMYSFIVYVMIYFAFISPKSIIHSKKNKTIQFHQPIISYLNQLQNLLEEEKIYRNANISMPEIASKLKLNTNQLSYLINDNFKKSFSDYINYYRITDVKSKLCDPSSQIVTIESIAYECGFNSLASFRSAFKKIENITPSEYRKKFL